MSQNFPWRFPWTIGRSQAHLDAFYNARPTVMGRIWRSLETGPQGAVCQNYQAQNQIFKSKYKEWELGAELRNQSILFYRLMILSCCLQNYWNLDIERKQQKISGVVFQRAFPETGPKIWSWVVNHPITTPPLFGNNKTNKPWLLSVVKVDSNDAETLVTGKGQKQTKKQQLKKSSICYSGNANAVGEFNVSCASN